MPVRSASSLVEPPVPFIGPVVQVPPGRFAGGHDAVVQCRGNAKPVKLRCDDFGSPRGIGEEDQFLGCVLEPFECVDNAWKDGYAVMHHAPKVKDEPVVALGDSVHALQDGGRHGRSPAVNRAEGGSWLKRGSPNKYPCPKSI